MVSLAVALMLQAGGPAVLPKREYNGIGRALPVTVRPIPAVARLTLALYAAGEESAWREAPLARESADLAKLFPELWTAKRASVLYVQARINGRDDGTPLVLQPMTNPPVARLNADGKTIDFLPDEDQEFAGYRAYPDRNLQLRTSMGDLEFRLRPDCAPNTVVHVRGFVTGGLYTDTIWHRIVAKHPVNGNPFVIQGGDPAGTGSGGPGWAYALEKSSLPHDFGVVSIARSTDPNTNGCQLFVALSRDGTKHLDGKYAAFGQLVKGADVLRKLAAVPVGKQDRPLDPPKIREARLVEAGPYAGRQIR
ncbi:MAG: peptidylprolyl isomerase [Fimbriimonadaceae bacterium]|nr:peptidylprolyl isomerase [Fimbriimonadaceae bacterium]